MTHTLISMISIFVGIAGAYILVLLKKEFSLGFTGNTIAGIFGSIFFIKLFSRLGFGPFAIMETGELNVLLFSINITVALLGGAIGLILARLVINKMNKEK